MIYKLNDKSVSEKIKIQGRYEELSDGISLDWTASSAEFNAMCGGDVYFSFNAGNFGSDNGEKKLHFTLFVDGERVCDHFEIFGGENRIKMAENLELKTHSFKLLRLSEARLGNVALTRLELEGELLSVPLKAEKFIEIIGDSITCGYGNLVPATVKKPASTYTSSQDASKAYSYLAVTELGVDYSITSRSGIAALYGYDYDPSKAAEFDNFLNSYNMQCRYRDPNVKYQPKRKSDIIVINIGSNDVWSCKAPSPEALSRSIADLALLAKEKSPKAVVVFMTGGIFDGRDGVVTEAAKMLGGEEKGFFVCPNTSGYYDGGNGHPSVAQHRIMADELIAFIKKQGLI